MAKKVKKKMFKLKNKDEVEEFLKSQGFEVRVEREEEELDEGIVYALALIQMISGRQVEDEYEE